MGKCLELDERLALVCPHRQLFEEVMTVRAVGKGPDRVVRRSHASVRRHPKPCASFGVEQCFVYNVTSICPNLYGRIIGVGTCCMASICGARVESSVRIGDDDMSFDGRPIRGNARHEERDAAHGPLRVQIAFGKAKVLAYGVLVDDDAAVAKRTARHVMRARAMSGDGDDNGLVVYGDFVGGGGLQLANRVGANWEQRLVCDRIAIQCVSADKGMRKVAA